MAYDDASTDDTVEILRNHPKVALIVANGAWEEDVAARKLAEGRHRGLLLEMARAELPHDWMLCFDPDERITGDLRGFVRGLANGECDALRVQLFDAYMTPKTTMRPIRRGASSSTFADSTAPSSGTFSCSGATGPGSSSPKAMGARPAA